MANQVDIDNLVTALAKPIMLYRFNLGRLRSVKTERQQIAAQTLVDKAVEDIHDVVTTYIGNVYPDAQLGG